MEVVLRFENICSSRRFLKPLLISQCFMWFGSHFTVGVTRRLLLSSRVSLLVINLLTIRERKETRDEINLRTHLFSSRTQV